MTTLTRQDLNFGQGRTRKLKVDVPKHPTAHVAAKSHPPDSSVPVVADILCEFLEVAIHLILYVREVYPSGIFQKRKKYNVPVQVCVYLLYVHSFNEGLPSHMSNTGLLFLMLHIRRCHVTQN